MWDKLRLGYKRSIIGFDGTAVNYMSAMDQNGLLEYRTNPAQYSDEGGNDNVKIAV
jgi:hypothetical protein